MRRRAFTLIELLVVIAIIAILAAFLMPGLERAREAADYALCTHNMKQHALSVAWYATDYGDYMPINTRLAEHKIAFTGASLITDIEALWYNSPEAQGPLPGVAPELIEPADEIYWPMFSMDNGVTPVLSGVTTCMAQWPNRVFAYNPVHALYIGCPQSGQLILDLTGGMLCTSPGHANEGTWVCTTAVGWIGGVDCSYGYNEGAGHASWANGDDSFAGIDGSSGNGRTPMSADVLKHGELTHPGDTVFLGHANTAGRYAPASGFSYSKAKGVWLHPYYGWVNRHYGSTGVEYDIPLYPLPHTQASPGTYVIGKSPYMMCDSSVRGMEWKHIYDNAGMLGIGKGEVLPKNGVFPTP